MCIWRILSRFQCNVSKISEKILDYRIYLYNIFVLMYICSCCCGIHCYGVYGFTRQVGESNGSNDCKNRSQVGGPLDTCQLQVNMNSSNVGVITETKSSIVNRFNKKVGGCFFSMGFSCGGCVFVVPYWRQQTFKTMVAWDSSDVHCWYRIKNPRP